MATKTATTETPATETAGAAALVAAAASFSKEQILAAKKYADRRDLLSVLLAGDRSYTLAEVDAAIKEFMRKEVK